jgi:hypothetical protein
MTAARISDADNQLLRAWRRDALDEAATQALEERLFFEPGLVEAARIDDALADELRRTAAPPARRPARLQRPIELLMAAGLGALAVLPFVGTERPNQQVTGNIEWVSISPMRSTTAEPMLVVPRTGTDLLAFEVAAASPDGTRVSAWIQRDDGTKVLDVDGLHVREGAVTFVVGRNALAGGVHLIGIVEAGASAPLQPKLSIRYVPDANH